VTTTVNAANLSDINSLLTYGSYGNELQVSEDQLMQKRRTRKGVAAVEFAVCLPILIMLIVGMNEICSALYLKEQVTVAAYEGGRVGVQRGSTDAVVTDYIKHLLDERGIQYDGNVVQISNPGFNNAATMEHVTITVTVPLANNSITGNYITDQNISANVTLRKEFAN
jgi:hypothetical protein